MTEEDAKKKWCPAVRFSTYQGMGVSNRDSFGGGRGEMDHCIGSDCMLWRWLKIWDEKPTRGYCGLGREVIHE